jgi:SAM-dependent methyltransferase
MHIIVGPAWHQLCLIAALPSESVAADTAVTERSLASTLWRINMESAEILDAYFALATSYQNLFAAYRKRGVNRILNPNDQELIDRSDVQIRHYYSVGADATRVIINALLANSRQPPQSILDFPSGSGRVTRHLRAFFPEARIVASDLYDAHLEFCREAFQIDCLLSQVNVSEIDFGEKFDLIFCGSLLTHLPEALFSDTINLLGRSLSDSGIAVVTLHGRFSDHLQATRSNFYLPDQDYEVAAEGVRRTGFGYVDYPHNILKGLFNKEEGYGIALVRPHWVLRLLEPRTDLKLLGYVERGWDNHQDVLIFGRPGVNA